MARRVSAPSDVDDVVQDVFLRMQRGVSALRDEERFGPWVYQVARSAIAEHRRARTRHPVASEAPEETSADALDDTVECYLTPYVAQFVAMLPTPYRETLTLTELQGLTHKQAAEMLNASLSGVKSRVQRGRAQLRELLDQCCEFVVDARGRVIECEPRAAAPCRSCGPPSR